MPEVQDWFLTPSERGNRETRIDVRRGDGRAWTEGNRVEPLVHGATYFARLLAALRALGDGDLVGIFDWRGDTDERLDGEGTELGKVLAELTTRGVQVRGLLWRSHPSLAHFQEEQNQHLGEVVNAAGAARPNRRRHLPPGTPSSQPRSCCHSLRCRQGVGHGIVERHRGSRGARGGKRLRRQARRHERQRAVVLLTFVGGPLAACSLQE